MASGIEIQLRSRSNGKVLRTQVINENVNDITKGQVAALLAVKEREESGSSILNVKYYATVTDVFGSVRQDFEVIA